MFFSLTEINVPYTIYILYHFKETYNISDRIRIPPLTKLYQNISIFSILQSTKIIFVHPRMQNRIKLFSLNISIAILDFCLLLLILFDCSLVIPTVTIAKVIDLSRSLIQLSAIAFKSKKERQHRNSWKNNITITIEGKLYRKEAVNQFLNWNKR